MSSAETLDDTVPQLKSKLKFWINASSNTKVCNFLEEQSLPIKLYEGLKSKDSDKSETIIKKHSPSMLKIIVDLVLKASAGNEKSERQLADAVIKDIQLLGKIRDNTFINSILLPLIRNEATRPVSLFEKEKYLRSEDAGEQWQPNYDELSSSDAICKDKSKKPETVFLPSDILNQDLRVVLEKGFKEIFGKQSKQSMEKILEGKWSCIHTMLQKQNNPSQFKEVAAAIQNKGPVFMLCQGTHPSLPNETIVVGGFCQNKFPATIDLTPDNEYIINNTAGDFLFSSSQNRLFTFLEKTSGPMLEVICDYEQGGFVSIGADFLAISYSYDFSFNILSKNDIHEIKPTTVETPQGVGAWFQLHDAYQVNVQKVEIWAVDTESKGGSFNSSGSSNVNVNSVVSQTDQMRVSGNSGHPWIVQNNPFNLYRSRPVFMVPRHVTISQLSKVLLSTEMKLKVVSSEKEIEGETLESVF